MMFLTKRKPTDLFDLFNQFDDHLGFFALPWRTAVSGNRDRLRPAMEAYTKDGHLVLRAELPGVDPEDLDIALTEGRLTIRGEKKQERVSDEGELHFREIAHGRFERSFELPGDVDPQEIKASHADGILEVTVPFKDAPGARTIPIETGGRGGKRKAA
jgi:HSP20 family protein